MNTAPVAPSSEGPDGTSLQPMRLPDVDPRRMPRHVACVMDGNGRWAARRGLPRTEGHRAGEDALMDAARGAVEIGLEYLTVYAFSTENWRRPHEEVRFLLNVIAEDLLVGCRDELHALGVRVRFVGRRDWRVPRTVLRRMDDAVEMTKANKKTTLTVAFNYGGRAEIVDAVKALVADGVKANKVDEKALRRYMYMADVPDPDLFIRTSGEFRVSNFLLWEIAYSELVFMDVLWPDFRRQHLFDAVREFQRRDRRFGLTREQKQHEGLPS